ncbi:MAG TPA: hypothetical protein VFU79_08690 [Nitrososphaeraceae archaeon]|nr:hypothetical protein [Nitrososphaeraceae archaeon]
MFSALKKNAITKALKYVFRGFDIAFISMLLIFLIHDVLIGQSSTTTILYQLWFFSIP